MDTEVWALLPETLPEESVRSLRGLVDDRTFSCPGPGGFTFTFRELLGDTGRTSLGRLLDPLLDGLLTGHNGCMLLLGPTGSDKERVLAGMVSSQMQVVTGVGAGQQRATGLVPLAMQRLFAALESGATPGSRAVALSLCEMSADESVRDLMMWDPPAPGNEGVLQLDFSPQEGIYVRGLRRVAVGSAAEASTVFHRGWARRAGAVPSEFGISSPGSTLILTLHLHLHAHGDPHGTSSWLRFVELPGTEGLPGAEGEGGGHEQPGSRSLRALARVAGSLADSPGADRVIDYSGSVLTELLSDVLGGNCATRVLCTLPRDPAPAPLVGATLRLCAALARVCNFPASNHYHVQGLLTQLRARLQAARGVAALGMGPKADEATQALREHVRRLTNENEQLRDKNERVYNKLQEAQERLGQLAGSRSDLSSKLVMSEEEKLKISKELIELQIQANHMREHYEAEGFELKNTVVSLESRVHALESERERIARDAKALRTRLGDVERNRKQLADEYIALKGNYMALSKEHEKEVAKTEELSMELMRVAGQHEGLTRSHAAYQEAAAELQRVRSLVSRLSERAIKPEDIIASERERRALERSLFGNQTQMRGELESLKKTYDEQQKRLEDKVVSMGRELQEARRSTREAQHKLAEQAAALLTSESNLKDVEVENSRLQLQLKELNEEYRSRLQRYVRDLADYVDGAAARGMGEGGGLQGARTRHYVDAMLQDVRAAHRAREEQLAAAARSYKKRARNVLKQHEPLLIAYRVLRDQVVSLGRADVDPGPPEARFSLTDAELQTAHSRELAQLRENKAQLEGRVRELSDQLKVSGGTPAGNIDAGHGGWAELKKQLREFTHTTQEDLERERAQLLSRALVAEEQLAELQEYVDTHLIRYKQEVTRLRGMLGQEAGLPRVSSASTPEPPGRAARRRVTLRSREY
ncbi:LOW QUALITY PROTEIN: coiled-coil domain-containing protein 78 [Lethenteron reissneri]|uniref:LOW QUALITY PROTEIN: coiled-coil domain-containing protein 78 n=1 Tax=Lethenteron reissneri TaxID=7753 RepID=UPI002AB6B9B2|nr:LOW QUALITY PROTEIN: coiled-coil domain-containing protein 78 [Lethenteron reissneri]